MTQPKQFRLGAACLILMLLVACAPADLQATPTQPADTAVPSTSTLVPTSTFAPTATTALTAPQELATTNEATQQATTASGTQPAPTAAPVVGGAADKYQYLGQDVVDRSQFLPNRTVTITWTVKNVGTTTWTTDYMLRFFSGPKASQDFYNFTKEVAPEGTINFIVTFTTPSAPGDYDMWFKLTNAAGQNFGDLDLLYTVTNTPGAATSTPAN